VGPERSVVVELSVPVELSVLVELSGLVELPPSVEVGPEGSVVVVLPGTIGVPSVVPLLLQMQEQFPWGGGMPGKVALPLGKVEFAARSVFGATFF